MSVKIHRVMQDAGDLHAAFVHPVEDRMPSCEADPAAGMEFVPSPPALRCVGDFLKCVPQRADVAIRLLLPPLGESVGENRIQVGLGEP